MNVKTAKTLRKLARLMNPKNPDDEYTYISRAFEHGTKKQQVEDLKNIKAAIKELEQRKEQLNGSRSV